MEISELRKQLGFTVSNKTCPTCKETLLKKDNVHYCVKCKSELRFGSDLIMNYIQKNSNMD